MRVSYSPSHQPAGLKVVKSVNVKDPRLTRLVALLGAEVAFVPEKVKGDAARIRSLSR